MEKRTTFLFDLDSILTEKKIISVLSKKINRTQEIKELEEKTKMEKNATHKIFQSIIEMLKEIPIDEVEEDISNIKFSTEIMKFIEKNKQNCYIVTKYLDVWINKLIKKINMENHCICSTATIKNNKIEKITKLLSINEDLKKVTGKMVVISDGKNDKSLYEKADISIGYSGIRNGTLLSLEIMDYMFLNEKKLCEFLNRLK